MGVVAHGAPVFRIGGDPGGISTRAAVMMERANEFADIHAGLSSLTSDGWQGRAADHFRYKFNLQIKGWLDAQIAFSDASTAYQSYASTLLSAQSQCDEIRSRWEQGRNAVEQAQNNKANARSQAAAEGGTPAFDASCDEGPGRSTMAAAEADFQSLVNQVNESGTLLINALNSGISKLPERTWMDSVARTFKSVYDGFVEATIDLVKLAWFIGGQAVLYDIGRVICGYMTPEELVTKWVELPGETVAGLFKVLSEKPGAFFEGLAKGLFDYDTFIDDPGRWVGHAIPDILITIATAGAGGGASAGSKAATGASKASRIGRALFKELTHIADLEDIANLSKLAFNKLKKVGIHAVTNLSDIAENAAERLRRLKEAGHTGNPPLLSPADNTPSVPSSGAPSSPSHGAPSYGTGGTPSVSASPSYGSGSTPNTSGMPAPSHGNGGYSGNASHGGAGAADPNSRFAPPGQQSNGMSGAAHSGDAGTTDPTSNYAPPTHQQNGTPGTAQPGTTPQASGGAGNTSHTSHGGADAKDSALPPTDPGHRSNGVSSAAQPAATPHAPAAGDASGHAAPAAPAPSASHGAHNNAFMNADTGGATHGAGNAAAPGTSGHTGAPAAGSHGAPATGAPASGTHGAPATGAPATGTHGTPASSAPVTGAPAAGTHGTPASSAPATGAPAAGTHGAPSTGAGTHGAPATGSPATGAPATGSHGAGASGAPAAPGAPSSGSHGAASGHGAAGGSPAAPARNNGMGEHVATGEPIPPRKPTDPDKPATGSGRDFQSSTNKTDTHSGGNQKNLDHLDFKPGDSDKVSNGQYRPIDPSGGPHRGGTDGAPKGDNFEPKLAVAGDGKPPRKPNNSWDSDGFSTNRDDYDLFGVENRKDSSYLDHSSTHANGEARGADELVGAGVGRSEASVGAQGSYERGGAFGGSDPSRVSHGADSFGGTANFGANAGHAGHGAHGVSNSADVGGGVGDASRGTHAAGAPTGQGGGHVGADTGTHGGSSAPAQGSYPAAGNTHAPSQAGSGSGAGYGGNHQAGQGANGHSGASSSHDTPHTPKTEPSIAERLGGENHSHPGNATPHTNNSWSSPEELRDILDPEHSLANKGDIHGTSTPETEPSIAERLGGENHSHPGNATPHTNNSWSSPEELADILGPQPTHADNGGLHGTDMPALNPDSPANAPHAGHGIGSAHKADTPDTAMDQADMPTREIDGNAVRRRAGAAAGNSADFSWENNIVNKSGKADDAGLPQHTSDPTVGADAPHAPHAGADGATDTSHAGHGDGASHTADGNTHAADPNTPTHEADGATDTSTGNKDKYGSAESDGAAHPTTSDEDLKKNPFDDLLSSNESSHAHHSTPDAPHATHAGADGATDTSHAGHGDGPSPTANGKADDAAHHDGDEHPKDTDDKHSAKNDDADTHKSTKDEADTHKSDKDGDGKSDKDDDGKDDADDDSDKDDSDKSKEYKDLHDHSQDGKHDPSYDPDSDPHRHPDPDIDTPPDPSIDQTEPFPEGVDPFTTPVKTRRQLEQALEAWSEYNPGTGYKDRWRWDSGRTGLDDVVNPETALGYNPDGTHRSLKQYIEAYGDPNGKGPLWPYDVEGYRKNGALLDENYHEYKSTQPFIDAYGSGLCRLGDPGGKYAAALRADGSVPSLAERGLYAPYSLGAPELRAHLTGKLPEGYIAKHGTVAPAFGQPGGAIQLQIWRRDKTNGKLREVSVEDWEDLGIIRYDYQKYADD